MTSIRDSQARQVSDVRDGAKRLAWIDNLRILLIAMVIAHHAAQSYGPTGGDWPIFNTTRAAILGPFLIVNAAFGMGLFFLIAGYFVPRSYDRKGGRRYLQDRLIRLALPLLFMSLMVFPLPAYIMAGHGQPLGPFLATYLRRPAVLHLWFVSYLIVFTLGYVMWRSRIDRRPAAWPQPSAIPTHRAILGFVLGLAIVTFIVRIAFPIDRWVDPAPFLHVEPAHLPQYVSLFVLGTVAARRDWLHTLPTATGMVWLGIGLAASALPYAATMLRMLAPVDIRVDNGGGLSLGALVWSALEALIAVGLSIGLLTLFRERVNHGGGLSRALAAGVYAVYLLHVFPVLGVQLALVQSSMAPLAKFGVVTLIAVPLSFGLAYGLRKVPGVRRVV